ncbi:MAG: hypothetical protein H6R17_4091 [Proteobacteria bacterium]|nr:hypothetical protein [Pseudomonadota bacterium]
MKTRRKTANKHEGEIFGATDFHRERVSQEQATAAKNEAANRPQGTYEYEQMIAENAVFNPKQMIEDAAFFIAERRDFAPGYELADWLQAEAEVETRLAAGAA